MRARGIREEVVEKDYVLGWVLWGIGTDPVLGRTWVFKVGTCLRKCYNETYRFSEDLDFTVIDAGPINPEAVLAALDRVLDRVSQRTGRFQEDRRGQTVGGIISARRTMPPRARGSPVERTRKALPWSQ